MYGLNSLMGDQGVPTGGLLSLLQNMPQGMGGLLTSNGPLSLMAQQQPQGQQMGFQSQTTGNAYSTPSSGLPRAYGPAGGFMGLLGSPAGSHYGGQGHGYMNKRVGVGVPNGMMGY